MLSEAVQNSMQWKSERSRGELTTECLTIITPNNPYEDMIVQLVVAQEHVFSMTAVIDVNIVFWQLLTA
jgi:hypothetical protein